MRKVTSAAMVLAVAVVLAGCSGGASLVNHAQGSSAAARIGDTLTLETASGHPFTITLTQVADPAHGQGSATPHHLHYFVATRFRITDTSGDGISGDTAADANLVESNGNVILPAKVSTKTCLDLAPKYHLAAGKSASTCVSYEVKAGVTVTQVQFFPAAGSGPDYGEWLTH
jgi:hypothetical protein